MPRLILTEAFRRDLERCRAFLKSKSPTAAQRAFRAIILALDVLETAPFMGRPYEDDPELRELVIAFGDSGYVALYRMDTAENALILLALRHQKEAGF